MSLITLPGRVPPREGEAEEEGRGRGRGRGRGGGKEGDGRGRGKEGDGDEDGDGDGDGCLSYLHYLHLVARAPPKKSQNSLSPSRISLGI